MGGQVIYMDRGVEYFALVKEYLVKELGFKDHEVGMIYSKMRGGKKAMDKLKNQFLGVKYNEKTKSFERISHEDRMKIVIGSSTIKEGINLQKYSTTLYNCFLHWNPTDVVQVEGRIWRQGNKFGSIRIVTPLMIDSMDIFMFQKLQEKTSRINAIWNVDGQTNVLKTEEFDPQELKEKLISDPMVIAQMEADETTTALQEDISSIDNEVKVLQEVMSQMKTVEREESDFREIMVILKHSKTARLTTLITSWQKVLRSQTDKEGLHFKDDRDEAKKKYSGTPVERMIWYEGLKPSYWMENFFTAVRSVERQTERLLKPKKIDANVLAIQEHVARIESQKGGIKEDMEKQTGEEAVKARAQEIARKREEDRIEEVPVEQRVKDFSSMNHLLSDLRVKEPTEVDTRPLADQLACPPIDKEGDRRIDPEAISILEQCIAAEPQTKELYTDEAGEYSESRKGLHERIINKLVKGSECVEREQPVAILTGGVAGSGKTTFMKRFAPYMTSDKIFKIDADDIRAQLPENRGWNSAATHRESKDIIGKLLDRIGEPCTHDILYDGTMNRHRNYIPLVDKLKGLGYKVFIIYMSVPYKVSVERVLNRYKKSGRYVPMELVKAMSERGMDGFNTLKTMVDGYMTVDGVTGEVIETHGDQIPTQRYYFDRVTKIRKDTKEKARARAKALTLLMKMKLK